MTKNNKYLQKTTKIDRNTLMLYALLESAMNYSLDNEISKRIRNILNDLDKIIFVNENFDINIISETCHLTTIYERDSN